MFQGEVRLKDYETQYTNSGIRYDDLKSELAYAIYEELQPIQSLRAELEASLNYVDQVIKDGAQKSRVVTDATVGEVREKMGLRQ